MIRILDIDNCIADDGWRVPEIDWKSPDPFTRYHTYHSLAPMDAVGNRDLFEATGLRIFLFTSRPARYRRSTEAWLELCRVPFEALLMRSDEDHRPSVQVKTAQLWEMVGDYHVHLKEVECAYDDRPEIVAMYQERGLRAEVRAIHNVCAYTNPEERKT